MVNKTFGKGTKCKTKTKPHRYCTILSVFEGATRKNTWTIQFADDGSTHGPVTSQQLLKFSIDDVFPVPATLAEDFANVAKNLDDSDDDSEATHSIGDVGLTQELNF